MPQQAPAAPDLAAAAPEQTVPLTPFTQVAAMTVLPPAEPPAAAPGQQAGLVNRVKLAVLGAPAGLTLPGRPGGLAARRPPETAAAVLDITPAAPQAGPAVRGPEPPVEPWLRQGRDRLHQTVSVVVSPLSGLAGDPRLTRWIRRAVACAVLGTALAILVNPLVGLLAAALVAAADLLYQSRTSAVIPATVRAASAQRRTRRRLARLTSAGYLSLHARAIPGTDAVIDHLVVGPGGIYAVDSEVWDKRLPVRATRGGELFHGPFDQSARLSQARWEAGEASRLMSEAIGQPVAIRPAMVIYGAVVPWIMIKISGVDVFCGGRLRKYLNREASANHAWRLDDRQTEAFHAVAAQVLPPAH